jgi:hypothetical protein
MKGQATSRVYGMAYIEIVQPVEGATQVVFDYVAAGDAIDQLSAMSRVLGEQADARIGPKDDVIINWAGQHRGDFDEAWSLLQSRFNAGVEAGGWAMLEIYGAVADANDAQRVFNQNALDAQAQDAQPQGPN